MSEENELLVLAMSPVWALLLVALVVAPVITLAFATLVASVSVCLYIKETRPPPQLESSWPDLAHVPQRNHGLDGS